MNEASNYGQHYWCVRLPQSLTQESNDVEGTVSDVAEIYLWADTCTVLPSGAVEFSRAAKDEKTGEQVRHVNLALAPGEWICVYAADVEDRHAVAVES